jgi:hypothetical protein
MDKTRRDDYAWDVRKAEDMGSGLLGRLVKMRQEQGLEAPFIPADPFALTLIALVLLGLGIFLIRIYLEARKTKKDLPKI